MDRYRLIHFLVCFTLLCVMVIGLAGDHIAFAAQEGIDDSLSLPPAQEQPSAEDKLEIASKLPVLSGESGDVFEYDVELTYTGERRGFDLTTEVPPGWAAVVLSGSKEIPFIELEEKGYAERITVRFGPLSGQLPEPGEYVVTLRASSGDIQESIQLKAVVTARYEFIVYSGLPQGNLNPKVTAGKEYHMPVLVINSGTAAVEDIAFSSIKPEGWEITYNPEEIDLLEAGLAQEVDVVIAPPSKAIAGDYSVTLNADGKQYSADYLRLRVTVQTSTIWGGAGVAIVVAVIAGLIVMFMRLGRR